MKQRALGGNKEEANDEVEIDQAATRRLQSPRLSRLICCYRFVEEVGTGARLTGVTAHSTPDRPLTLFTWIDCIFLMSGETVEHQKYKIRNQDSILQSQYICEIYSSNRVSFCRY